MFTYKTHGTCSRAITFDVDSENKLRNVKFSGGCMGNTQGVAKLCEGRDIDEVQSVLKGILCRNGTSCPDQLSKAIEEYKKSVINA
ncbi:MAG TPA: TIGR03905 family TSCPD domain-containing protein [Candidatus Coproplasma excrementigallinarum]|uniref:ribonucleoside-diphosphate reductase n=1 Tax=Candidatus Coproplasma excrementigallinarum TaxID=2840747 RepID=A0A9D1MK72_9FIRM|nr:TIGR03905 family TSCPD domain-containing protein [Candidatus Coproplasma excrementigallinarum]